MSRTPRRPLARGFTLIELMVVMVIIAILASLISVAVVKVIASAKITKVKTELDGMHGAIIMFKTTRQLQSLPPNFQDATALKRFWDQVFPWAQEQPPTNLTAAQALVFWLSSFSSDRNKPISGQGTRSAAYPFVVARLHDPANPTDTISAGTTSQWVNSAGKLVYPVYWPDHTDMSQPYVYLDVSRNYQTPPTYQNAYSGNTLAPYKNDAGNAYVNAQSFQIICAGVDNDHGKGGNGGNFPSGIAGGDMDNITNFAKGLLVDEKP